MPKRNLTDEDIRLLEETFATKDEVRNIVQEVLKKHVGNLPTKNHFDKRMDELVTEIKA